MLCLPFWVVLTRHVKMPPQHPPCGGDYLLTFTNAAKAFAYLEARIEGDWELRLISRPTLKSFLAELRREGVPGVCHDPNADGSGGTFIPLNDFPTRQSA